jgi:amidophosphoribosyltransferase
MGSLDGATVFSSETCALDGIGAAFVRDIKPGELISVDKSGNTKIMQKDVSKAKYGLCVFEYVYFARPDSFIDGISVHESRKEMGRRLYRQRPTEADLVCGVPDSGISAAYGYSEESGIPYGSAFIKNRYVGRTFIAPTQLKRERLVSVKLNPLRASVNGKRLVLVDDSIVRGTTSANIIKALRAAGAKEIHLRISSPPFKYPCYFGTDVDSRDKLIANHYSLDEICKRVGADSLEYLTEDNLMSIKFGQNVGYCGGCFNGDYPIKVKAAAKDTFKEGGSK